MSITPVDKKGVSPDGITQPGHAAADHGREHSTDIDAESGLEKPIADDGAVVDAVWGRIEAGSPNYRALSWLGASVLLTKIQVSTSLGGGGVGTRHLRGGMGAN